MLNVTQSSAVGFIEITVDETTGDVSTARFLPYDTSYGWVDLSFLNDALRYAFSSGNWGVIGETLATEQLPAALFTIAYNHLDDWDYLTPSSMRHARDFHIRMALTELAQRALAFDTGLLRVYGYLGEGNTKGSPRVAAFGVADIGRETLRLDFPGEGGLDLDVLGNGDIVLYTRKGFSYDLCATFRNVEEITEGAVFETLRKKQFKEEAAENLAAAVNRMILVNPDRFRPQD